MILEKDLIFCEGKELSGGDAATDVIDLVKGGDAIGDEMYLVGVCSAAGAGGTSAVFSLETSDASDFSTKKALYKSDEVPLAELTAGKKLFAVRVPRGCKRYLRGYIDVTGTFTAGKVDMFLVEGDHHSYEDL